MLCIERGRLDWLNAEEIYRFSIEQSLLRDLSIIMVRGFQAAKESAIQHHM